MDAQIRPIQAAEFEPFFRMLEQAFGEEIRSEDLAVERKVFEVDRSLAAFEGERIVGTAAAYSLNLTVPGATLPMPGVTAVGVQPTHRRRGLLTMLMRRQLEDFRDAGEIIAGLWASEGAIYQR